MATLCNPRYSLHIPKQENMQTLIIPILCDANTKLAIKLESLIRIHLQGQSKTHRNGFL